MDMNDHPLECYLYTELIHIDVYEIFLVLCLVRLPFFQIHKIIDGRKAKTKLWGINFHRKLVIFKFIEQCLNQPNILCVCRAMLRLQSSQIQDQPEYLYYTLLGLANLWKHQLRFEKGFVKGKMRVEGSTPAKRTNRKNQKKYWTVKTIVCEER